MIIGTAHFKDLRAAKLYYRDYGYDGEEVNAKLRAGEIFIGPPKLKDGERVILIDHYRRYAVVTPEKATA